MVAIANLARQLENAVKGRGFANLARLRLMGLIEIREHHTHFATCSRPNGTYFCTLTAKGREMQLAAGTVLLS